LLLVLERAKAMGMKKIIITGEPLILSFFDDGNDLLLLLLF